MPKIIHPRIWASGEPEPEWSSIRRMPTRLEQRKSRAMRSRRSNALALVITACVLLVVTLIVFATVPGEMVVR